MAGPQRIVVYDRTCSGPKYLPGLSHAWSVGAKFYRARGDIDHVIGVKTWDEAFARVAAIEPQQPIAELQYWGHGRFGEVLVDGAPWDAEAFCSQHSLFAGLSALRERLLPSSLIWFRTCSAFGTARGQHFARAVADFFGCRAAGHTFIIGFWQSGLRVVRPGELPRWPRHEGIEDGTSSVPAWSTASAPNTITCFEGRSSLERLVR